MFLPVLQLSHGLSTLCSNTQGCAVFFHTSNPMRYINTLIPAKLFSLVSAASSTPPLQDLPSPLPLLLLDVPFPDVEGVPMSPCLCPPRGLKTFTRKSTALPRLCLPNGLLTFTHKSTQGVLANAAPTFTRKSSAPPRLCLPIVTFDFDSQVNMNVLSKCTPKNVLLKCTVKFVSKASSLLTSSHSGQARHCGTSLFVVQNSRSCELDTATLLRVLCVERPLRAWFCLWRSVSL